MASKVAIGVGIAAAIVVCAALGYVTGYFTRPCEKHR